MIEYVNQIKQLKDKINIDFEANIAEIINDPKAWADKTAEQIVVKNADKIIEARKLGEGFANGIKSKD